jgi:formyltetrahydrofolate hydrolase
VCYKTPALANKEDGSMEFIQKAKIRLEHWIHHNEEHYQEYSSFAKELEDAGKIESARHLKEMISLATRSTECLKKAMNALG